MVYVNIIRIGIYIYLFSYLNVYFFNCHAVMNLLSAKFSRYSSIFKYIILFDLLNRENLLSNLFCVHVRRSLINKL
jgi:hypothetical protein